jgi:glycine cleavage system H protein
MDKLYPEELLYTKEHEWCRIEDDVATIGITWHAQDALGDIVFCELPGVGESLSSGEPFGAVESVKAVSDLYAPISGEIVEANNAIQESPEGLNDECYDDGWMLKVKLSNPSEVEKLLKAADYVQFLEDSED